MKNYIGTKIIKAKKVTLKQYYEIKYSNIPDYVYKGTQDLNTLVYIVIYPPIGDNDEPYISMSPVDVFEKAYREIDESEIVMLMQNKKNMKEVD